MNGRWSTFLKHYDPKHTTSKNRCYQAYALYKNAEREKALSIASELWLVSYSQPDACDSIFKIWRDAGKLSHDLAWQRFALSMDANKLSLARYLPRFLSKEDKAFASQYLQVHRRPMKIIQSKHFSKQNNKNQSRYYSRFKAACSQRPSKILGQFRKISNQTNI